MYVLNVILKLLFLETNKYVFLLFLSRAVLPILIEKIVMFVKKNINYFKENVIKLLNLKTVLLNKDKIVLNVYQISFFIKGYV